MQFNINNCKVLSVGTSYTIYNTTLSKLKENNISMEDDERSKK